MIITIKGANFSLANIGTLSTYIISKSIGSGASFDIPNFVDKNSSVNWVITLDEGYTFGTYSVTMGGVEVTPTVVDNVMTISIAEVTGNVRIVVATVNENTGEEDIPVVPPVDPEEPEINPNILKYIQSNGTQYIKTGVNAGANTKIELKFGIVPGHDYGTYVATHDDSTKAKPQAILGSDWNTKGIFLLTQYNQFKYHCMQTTGQINGVTANGVFSDKTITEYGNGGDGIILQTNGDTLTVDGNVYKIPATNNTPDAKEIKIFDTDGTHTARTPGTYKLYYCKIWDGDQLVRDFVPYNENGNIGLYDNVSEQFFANSGSGVFVGE